MENQDIPQLLRRLQKLENENADLKAKNRALEEEKSDLEMLMEMSAEHADGVGNELLDKANTYLIEFLEEGADNPTFSAYVKSAEYTLRASACRSIFTPRHTYRWRVKGIDATDQIIGESGEFTFFLTSEIQ